MTIQQNYPAIKPSLNLDFANTKQLDPRITYSRASTGTYYDGKTVAKAEENLLTYSQEIGTGSWGTNVGVTVTSNSAAAPDGTTTADALAFAATNSYLYQQAGVGTLLGNTYTFSCWLWSTTGKATIALRLSNSSNGLDSTFTTISLTTTPTRYYITRTFTGSGYTVDAGFDNRLIQGYGDGIAGSVFAWGAQLEQRSFATAYTPTTTAPITNYIPVLQTASAGTPRFDHNPITGESLGLLIEEQRTNLFTYSETFDAPAWNKFQSATITANATTAPDGTSTADLLTWGTGGASGIYQSVASAFVCSMSLYAKAYSGSPLIGFGDDTGTRFTTFNLSTGALVSTSGTSSTSITPVGNGWYRLAVAFTTAPSTIKFITGTGTVGSAYIWGAQLEAGAFATSYIPTALTYSGRASTATFRGANGLIQTAAVNAPRYEVNAGGGSNLLLENAASNLLTYTEHLDNAAWTKTRANIALNSAVAPDGTLTGDKLVEDTTANNTHFVMQTIAVTSGTSYTFSVYAKAAERSRILIAVSSAAFTANQAIFDLTNGTTSNLVACTASIAAVGNGWYRCSWTATATASASPTFNVFLETGTPTYTGDGTSGAHIWGAQLEAGGAATSYIPSIETWTDRASTATYYDSTGIIRTAASGQPRYSFNPTLLSVSSKLLLEPQATNLLTRSEEFQTGWTVERATVQTNATTAPDGALTADKLLEDTAASNTHVLFQGTSSLTSGSILSFSVYVKASELSSLRLQINDGASLSNAVFANYDVSTGVASSTQSIGTFTAANSTITSVGNGWYRCSISGIATGVTAVQSRIFLVSGGATSYTGLGNRGVFVWGAQLETGAGATSYIPTVASQATRVADTSTSTAQSRAADVYSSSQVTRAADSASMTGTNFSSWFNQSEGTLYCAADSNVANLGSYAYFVSDSLGNNYYRATNNTTTLSLQSGAAGSNVVNLDAVQAGMITGISYPNAYAYQRGSFAGVVRNGTVRTSANTTMPLNLNQMAIGSSGFGGAQINGHVQRISYYPRRLTNTQLQALTS